MSLQTLQKLLLGQVTLDELHAPNKRMEPTLSTAIRKKGPEFRIGPSFLAIKPGLNGASNDHKLLQGKSFVLDGKYQDLDRFNNVLKQFGGKAMKKLSKSTSEFYLFIFFTLVLYECMSGI